jgi:DNA-binding beta-propeller fold protein YncE
MPNGQHAYITNRNSGTVTPFDTSTPLAPTASTPVSCGTGPCGIAAHPDVAVVYIANSTDGTVVAMSLSVPLAPVITGTVGVGAYPEGIDMHPSGLYAMVANRDGNSVTVLRLSNPLVPTVIATVSGITAPQGISISHNGGFALVNGSSGVTPVDLADPTHPVKKSTVATPGGVGISIAPDDSFALATNYGVSTATVLFLVDPLAPIIGPQVAVGLNPVALGPSMIWTRNT